MYAHNHSMHLVRALARPRLSAGVLVTLALLSAACSDIDPASRINAPPLRSNSSSGHSSGGSGGSGGSGPSLGAASGFAILSAADGGGGAVTCVGPAAITGNVGSSGLPAAVVIPANCNLIGTITAPVSASVVAAFDGAYAALALEQCTQTILTEAFTGPTGPTSALSVGSGVICFPREVTFTDATLTLTGNGPWLFKVGSGTGGTGALTGTNLNVVMPSGAEPCDVTWWVRAGATMTTNNVPNPTHFFGTILAGAAITVDGAVAGTFDGRALAKAAVSIKGGTFTGCGAAEGQVCREREDRVKGEGRISRPSYGKAEFEVSGGFNIKKNAFEGQLEYEDDGLKGKSDDIRVKGTGVTAYVIDGVTRHIQGTAKVNGRGDFTYQVDVSDNGESGRNDTFAIRLYAPGIPFSGTPFYSASGKLKGGNIQLHKADGRACKDPGHPGHHGHHGHHGHR